MGKVFSTICILFFCNAVTYCQGFLSEEDPCLKKIYKVPDFGEMYYDTTYNDYLLGYVKKNFPSAVNHITWNKKELVPLNKIISLDSICRFESDVNNFKIDINCIFIRNDLEASNSPIEIFVIDEKNRFVKKINGKSYYGSLILDKNQKQLTYSKISEMKVYNEKDTFLIPEELFDDLINPNLNYIYSPILPISAYWSPANESIYIYIMNDTKPKYNKYGIWNFLVSAAYVTKIIVDKKGNCQRIVMRGFNLEAYGWEDCRDFWVF